mgnify:CR=1 FL=1
MKKFFVGGSLREAANRVADAWHEVKDGVVRDPVDSVTFVSWSALASVMTDRRYELLRHLHNRPAPSIRALARDLARDFKRVHADVTALEAIGLIERDKGMLRADYSEIRAAIRIAA